MTPGPPATGKDLPSLATAEGKFQLLSTAATIFSIFFAVWWGFVTTQVFALQDDQDKWTPVSLVVRQGGYLLVSLVYAAAFTYYLTRMLWDLARLDMTKDARYLHMDVPHALRVVKMAAILAVFTLAAGLLIWLGFGVPPGLAFLGGGLLLMWCGVSIALFVWSNADAQRLRGGDREWGGEK